MTSTPILCCADRLPEGTPEVPVAIVGAGACGLTAALALREAGIDCVLIERDAVPQGSTALSSGFIPAAGTTVQRQAGITDDSAERFAADIQAKAHGTAAPHLVEAYTDATITDPASQVTTLTYDPAGRLETITDPTGRVETRTYDDAGQLVGR